MNVIQGGVYMKIKDRLKCWFLKYRAYIVDLISDPMIEKSTLTAKDWDKLYRKKKKS